MNKLKDFLYDISDYLLGLIIIGIIASLIFFRMGDSLTMNFDFMTKDNTTETTVSKSSEDTQTVSNSEVIVKDSDTISLSTDGGKVVDSGSNLEPVAKPKDETVTQVSNPQQESVNENQVQKTTTTQVSDTTITVKVPKGSSANGIGKILRSNGLIKDEKDFYNKSIEMKLDSKLQSGTFKLKTSMSLEDIVKKLAGQ